MDVRRVTRPRLFLSSLQVLFALLALICLGSLSSTQCWYHEPSERGFLWFLAPSTIVVAAADGYLERYGAHKRLRTAVDAVTIVFWIGGIGAAGQLNTLTASTGNCDSHYGPYPETGAVTAFAVFEVILFALATYHTREGLPWPQSHNSDSHCEDGTNPGTTIISAAQTSHLQSGDFSDYITVHVGDGDGQKDFPVPKGPICRRSKFVKSATSDAWTQRLGRSSKEKEVDLSDDDPVAFEIYLQCVLGNTVAVKDLNTIHPTRAESDGVIATLINTYILADKLGDPQSANLIIDSLARYCLTVQRVPNCDAVTYACLNSVKYSPLRILLVDLYHMGYDSEETRDDRLEGMPNEFLVQFSQKRSPEVQTVVPGSQRYHLRADRGQLYRTLFKGDTDS